MMWSLITMKNDDIKYFQAIVSYVVIIQLLTLDLQHIDDWSVSERLSFLAFGCIFVLFGVPYYNIFAKFVKNSEFSFKKYFRVFMISNVAFLVVYQFITFDLFNILDWKTQDRASFMVAYFVVQLSTFIWYDIRMTNEKKRLEKEENEAWKY